MGRYTTWRLDQPNYCLCEKWRAQIINPRTPGGRKKQLVTALARGFGVDWWRLQTGQTTLEKLGLVMNAPKTSSAAPSTQE